MTTPESKPYQVIPLPDSWTPQYEVARGSMIGAIKRALFFSPNIITEEWNSSQELRMGIEEVAANLADSAQRRRYLPGQMIFHQEENLDGVFILNRGKLFVDGGEEIKLRTEDLFRFSTVVPNDVTVRTGLYPADLLFIPINTTEK